MLAPPARAAKDGWGARFLRNHSANTCNPIPVITAKIIRAVGPRRPASMLYLTKNIPAKATQRPPSQIIQNSRSCWINFSIIGSDKSLRIGLYFSDLVAKELAVEITGCCSFSFSIGAPIEKEKEQQPVISTANSLATKSEKYKPIRNDLSEPIIEKFIQQLREFWMIWLGGLCVALAGIFLVRYSIEAGLLGPTARIILAVITGIGLQVLAEWLRRNLAPHPSFAALAGGASITLYAAFLAALDLYQLISPLIAFVAMGDRFESLIPRRRS